MFNYYRMIKNSFLLIVILPILFGATALGVTKMLITPTYQATASVVIEGKTPETAGLRYEDILASAALAKNMIVIAQSLEFVQDVVTAVTDPAVDVEFLQNSALIELVNNSNVVAISITDSNPRRAAELANAYADVLVKKAPTYVRNANLQILDNAVIPIKTHSPNTKLNVAAGLFAGLLLALTIAYMSDFIKQNKPNARW